MIEVAATPTRTAAGHTAGHDRLDQLVSQIATGDRTAFRCLYAFMAMRVWRSAIAAPLGHAGAVAVTQSTFVEVWHLAGAAARYDARDWIAAISTRRANDRLRAVDADSRDGVRPVQHLATAQRLTHALTVGDYDTHIHPELTALLGNGRSMVRTSPGVFIRVDDLDDALSVIAAASWAPVHATAGKETSSHVHRKSRDRLTTAVPATARQGRLGGSGTARSR
jgi:DNA-directed RNA polymerase specialized sigma24 family protein